jgi:MFS family permease
MALIFSARSVGYLLGAFIGGFLFDIFDKQLLLTATLLVAAVATMIQQIEPRILTPYV